MTQLSSALDHYSWLLVGLCGGWDSNTPIAGSQSTPAPPKSLLRDAENLFAALQAFLILFSPRKAAVKDASAGARDEPAQAPDWKLLVGRAVDSATLTPPYQDLCVKVLRLSHLLFSCRDVLKEQGITEALGEWIQMDDCMVLFFALHRS